MNKQMTLGQYRAIDIAMLSGAYAVCEILIYVASTFWYARELYIASPVAFVTALVMMRWGKEVFVTPETALTAPIILTRAVT